eukprot:TRINITY_DN5099_c0_g1_i1.p1 TRINITY_DN5099_c0_g1~~TRINITY_DN5099_c0_g1_i1.p1  ORF type:complete len:784 (+),score=232.93 TRINITY_DN5099_c0_g1_i1:194-2545(+)
MSSNTLVQAEADIAYVREGVEKSEELVGGIVDILSAFEERLSLLEETLLPVQNITSECRNLHDNIDKTIVQFEKVFSILDRANDLEAPLHAGIKGDSTDEVAVCTYLKYIDDINEAMVYTAQHRNFKSADKTLVHLKALRKEGLTECDRIMCDLVVQQSRSFDPRLLPQHREASGDTQPVQEEEEDAAGGSLYKLEPDSVDEVWEMIVPKDLQLMTKIAKRLGSHPTGSFRVDYQAMRVMCLLNSLKAMRVHRMVDPINVAAYVQGSHPFMYLTRNFQKLLEVERRMVLALVVSDDQQLRVFSKVVEPALDVFSETAETLLKVFRPASAATRGAGQLLGLFVLLDIRQCLMEQLPGIMGALNVADGSKVKQSAEVIATLKKVSGVCLQSFAEFDEYVRKDPANRMPVDGTVAELTASTITYTKKLVEYSSSVDSILAKIPPSSESAGGIPAKSKGKRTTAELVMKVLTDLKTNLESKARKGTSQHHSGQTLACLFMLNNFHYIQLHIKQSRLADIVSDEFLKECQQMVENHRNLYRRCWFRALQCITDGGSGKKDSDLGFDRKGLKNRFKGFNTEVEKLHETQKHYSIPDNQLLNQMRIELVETIVPIYSEFYKKYANANFSKTPEKYLRYDDDQLTDKLAEFFEGEFSHTALKKRSSLGAIAKRKSFVGKSSSTISSSNREKSMQNISAAHMAANYAAFQAGVYQEAFIGNTVKDAPVEDSKKGRRKLSLRKLRKKSVGKRSSGTVTISSDSGSSSTSTTSSSSSSSSKKLKKSSKKESKKK